MQGTFSYKTVLRDTYNNTKQNSQAPSFSCVFFHQAWVSLASPTFSSYTSCLNNMNFPSVLAFGDFSFLIRECVREEKNPLKRYITHGDLRNERLQCLENPWVCIIHSKSPGKSFQAFPRIFVLCVHLFEEVNLWRWKSER